MSNDAGCRQRASLLIVTHCYIVYFYFFPFLLFFISS